MPLPSSTVDGATGATSHTTAAFLSEQVELLGELDVLVVVPVVSPFDALAVEHLEDGSYTVRVPTRPPGRPLSPLHRERLDRLGYKVVDADVALGERRFHRAPEAAAAVATVLRDVFDHAAATPLDVRHGSRRPERDAARKLEALRHQLEPIITEFLGAPPKQDPDGDYLVPHGNALAIVAPRAMPGAIPLVRVATVTNLGITPSADVGTLLANLNFNLAVGRFALDAEHRAIWFDETLLGETVAPDVLKLAIEIVTHMASDWSGRFQQLFGGTSPLRAAPSERVDTARKPGDGGYL